MDNTVQIDSAVEQVVLDIKEEMESRANRLKYMKLRTFLSLLGYRKRKREVLELVDECLNEHGITVYAYGEELEDWFDISHNETITFRFVGEQTSSQGSKSSFAHAGTIEVSTGNNPVDLFVHQREAIMTLDERINPFFMSLQNDSAFKVKMRVSELRWIWKYERARRSQSTTGSLCALLNKLAKASDFMSVSFIASLHMLMEIRQRTPFIEKHYASPVIPATAAGRRLLIIVTQNGVSTELLSIDLSM